MTAGAVKPGGDDAAAGQRLPDRRGDAVSEKFLSEQFGGIQLIPGGLVVLILM